MGQKVNPLDFDFSGIFIREDLPLEARQAHASKKTVELLQLTLTLLPHLPPPLPLLLPLLKAAVQAPQMEHMTNSKLRLLSYNCRGWNSGRSFLESYILLDFDVCLIQEHWLTPEQVSFMNIHPDKLCSFGVSAINSSNLLTGCPYGGCGLLIRKSLPSAFKVLESISARFCALSIASDPLTTLIINVYLPSNYGTEQSEDFFVRPSLKSENFVTTVEPQLSESRLSETSIIRMLELEMIFIVNAI